MDALPESDLRRTMPRFQGENFRHNITLLDEFEALARENECSMAQLALAWVLAQRDDTLIPIPGTKRVKYVEENAGAVDLEISDEDLARAGEIANASTVSGDRYADYRVIGVEEDQRLEARA